ncbi:hypothetical protein Vafri_10609 [Volvox africanus]|uniref:Wax synthase domain-containing protein n=1 Tax=Volvox africanus TaxID=51714 RepID=A0A8J4B7G5_9CHLO|nr:hypothetical protein Vafri_10609 [Volvox africanus]
MHPPFWDTGITSNWRILGIALSYTVLAGWLKYFVGPRSLGSARVITALPVFVINTICPWIFNWNEELLLRVSTVFILSWMCNFKVLAFCWGRPPLWESMTVPQFAVAILLPLFPKPPESSETGPRGRLHDTSAGSATSLATRWIAKIALLGFTVFLVVQFGDSMPTPLLHYTYAFALYAFVGFLMDGPAALALEALGLQLIPTFDHPWMSSSLADFWGRRWNIPAASMLRTIVYDTVISGSLVKPARAHSRGTAPPSSSPLAHKTAEEVLDTLVPSASDATPQGSGAPASLKQRRGGHYQNDQNQNQNQNDQQQHQQHQRLRKHEASMLRRQLALNCTFFVSGIIHEYIAWLITGDGKWGWKWTAFFWVQAPLITLEAICSRQLRRLKVNIPRPLAILLTHLVLELTAYDLFFGFVDKDTGIAARTVAAVSASYHSLLAPLQPLIARLGLGL